jgi:hypothetical protein
MRPVGDLVVAASCERVFDRRYFSETAIVTMNPTSNTENNAAIGAGD